MNIDARKIYEFGLFRLDVGQKILWYESEEVSMPLKELEVLCLLVENRGRLVTKSELLERVWADSFVEENNLSRHIYLLRKTLGERGADKNLIENVPRRGYRFTGKVHEIAGGEIIVEKHTRTETLIEISEEETKEGEKRRRGEEEKKPIFLKLFSSPLLLFSLSPLLLLAAFFVYQNWRASSIAAAPIKSIAVLPFRTIDATQETEKQGLGLTDILITRLSNIREITVRPTSAVLSFETEDAMSAGQKLGTDAVLEGTIYRAGAYVRVTARLIRIADGASVWNGQFEKLKTDELRLQNEIALQVTDALRLNLSGSEKDALTKRYTDSPDALELYQKGRFEWNKRNWAGMLKAESLFRSAIEKDPNFALAYAGLADATLMMAGKAEEAENAIHKALELDPNLAEAHASLGFLRTFYNWDWLAAEASFKKAIELNPNYATAHHWYAQVLTVQGRHEEAKAEMRRALEINPLSHNFLADLGQIYYFNREYREAETYCRRALEIYPDFSFAHQYLMDIYFQTGRYAEAIEEHLAASKTMGTLDNQSAAREKGMEYYSAKTRKTFATGGIRKFVLEIMVPAPASDASSAYHQARSFALIDEGGNALDRLEQAFAGHGFSTLFVKADPVFDRLRDEPRFREILKKMKLE